jgi:xanthine/CO dehydrogenase XdhC/CoxF family maturation factor
MLNHNGAWRTDPVFSPENSLYRMEIFRLVRRIAELKQRPEQSLAMATVVGVKGSSYRSTGARMLITRDGHWYGTISGGCLEGDALRKARQVMDSQHPILVTYDTHETAHQQLKVTLGCNGIIDVLIEPFSLFGEFANMLDSIAESDHIQVLSTVVTEGDYLGMKSMLDVSGNLHGPVINSIHHDYLKLTQSLLQTGKYTIEHNGFRYDVLVEVIEPRIDLIIFGGGFDAQPVVKVANFLGWRTTVYDECVAHLIPINFSQADALISCEKKFISDRIMVRPYSAAVLMSHNYDYDYAALKALSTTSISYLGMLGPRKRLEKMIRQSQDVGEPWSDDLIDRIHAPIGLDLGAETPEEIALSITSEIQAFFRNKSGQSLRRKKGPIHDREGKDEVFRSVFQPSRQ